MDVADRERYPTRRWRPDGPDPHEVSMILLTGGTTGLPKAVPRTHNDYIASVEYHSRAWEITGNDVILTVAPVSHAQGMHTGVGSAFFNYARYVLTDSTEARDICKVIERERVTALPTVPALVQRVVDLPDLGAYDLSSLKKIYAGGAPSTPELVRAVYARLGCKFVNAFGSAEGLGAMTRLDRTWKRSARPWAGRTAPIPSTRSLTSTGMRCRPVARGSLSQKVRTSSRATSSQRRTTRRPSRKTAFSRQGTWRNRRIGHYHDYRQDQGDDPQRRRNDQRRRHRAADQLPSRRCRRGGDRDAGQVPGRAHLRLYPAEGGGRLSFEGLIAHMKSVGASVLQLPERVEFTDAIPLTKVGKADKKALKEDIKKKLGVS